MQAQELSYGIKDLLRRYNAQGSDAQGSLTSQHFSQLLFFITHRHPPFDHKPLYLFQDLLAVLSDIQTDGDPSCYLHLYIQYLTSQQAHHEKQHLYQQAQRVEQHIRTIESNEFNRRLRMLNEVEDDNIEVFVGTVDGTVKELEEEWKKHLREFEEDSEQIVCSTKMRQADENKKSMVRLRAKSVKEALTPRAKTQLASLEERERQLVQSKEYKKALKTRDNLSSFKTQAEQETLNKHEQFIHRKLAEIKRGQTCLLNNIKDRIQFQRHIQESTLEELKESLVVRINTLTRDFYTCLKEQKSQLVSWLRSQFRMPEPPRKQSSPSKRLNIKFTNLM